MPPLAPRRRRRAVAVDIDEQLRAAKMIVDALNHLNAAGSSLGVAIRLISEPNDMRRHITSALLSMEYATELLVPQEAARGE